MLPPLMLTLNARPTQLYSSKCVRVTMDERTSRVTITAHRGDDGDASCAISGIIQATDALLGRGAAVFGRLGPARQPDPRLPGHDAPRGVGGSAERRTSSG